MVTANRNIISDNDGRNGGGMYICQVGTAHINNNTFDKNTASDLGGGVSFHNATDVNIDKNIFSNNIAGDSGGGVSCLNTNITTLRNNFFVNNSATNDGGAFHFRHAPEAMTEVNLINNTIVLNTANQDGGGIYVWLYDDSLEANIYNNIIWDNDGATGDDLCIINDGNNNYVPSTVRLYHNDFDPSEAGTHIQVPFTIDPSNLNNIDPLLVDLMNDNYHLKAYSPCIDTGTFVVGASDEDIDGDLRPQGAGYDMGTDEYVKPILPALGKAMPWIPLLLGD